MEIKILKSPSITDTHIYFTSLEVDWDGVKIDRLSVSNEIAGEWLKQQDKYWTTKLKSAQKSLIRFTLNKMNNKK